MSFWSKLFGPHELNSAEPTSQQRILKALFAAVEKGNWTQGFDKRTFFIIKLEGEGYTIKYGISIRGNVHAPRCEGVDLESVPIISERDALKIVRRICAIDDAKEAKQEAVRKQKETDLMRKLYP